MQLRISNSLFSFIKSIKSYSLILDQNDKKKTFLMFLLIGVGTFLEMLSIGIIFPIIQVILNDNYINDLKILSEIKNFLNVGYNQFIIYSMLLLILVFLIKNIFLLLIIMFRARFIETLRKKFSKRLHLRYLSQDYKFFTNTNTSVLIRNLHQEVPKIIQGIDGIIILLTEILVLLGISLVLLYISPFSTSLIIFITTIFFLVYVLITKKKFFKLGQNDQNLFSSLLKETQQGYGNFKEILIYQLKDTFLHQFSNILVKYCRNNRNLYFYQSIPRILFEQLGIFLVVGISIFIFFQEPSKTKAIGIISVYSYAFFRILPSINKLIVNIQLIIFVTPSLKIISDELKNEYNEINESVEVGPIKFEEKINLRDIHFSIDEKKKKILQKINLIIKKNSKVGIIGKTGSGKSTLLNLIMCLIKPTSGEIMVDEKKLIYNSVLWRKKISFVSQSSYLLDDTIINNITFNQDNESVNNQRLNEAIETACLKEFIDKSELKLNTIVGERGSKISGGELQRICIARAIYRDSEVLILDEFTSALDEKTEKKIIENIFKLQKTIIIASHRPQILQYCDEIYEVIDKNIKKIK